jgi:hypothetical protein
MRHSFPPAARRAMVTGGLCTSVHPPLLTG